MILLDSLELNATKRRPVWIMRQAGRYLSTYQEFRKKYSFDDFCSQPELAVQLSLLPLKRYDLDAAIIFSDILIPLRAFGLKLEFTEKGPELSAPQSKKELENLPKDFDPKIHTPTILQSLKELRKSVDPAKAVLGFSGAPFTMLAYMLEGKLTKDLSIVKKWMAEEPKLVHQWLDVLAKAMGDYLEAQVSAGADAVQVFDTWASQLSPQDFEKFALPYARQVISAVPAPCVYYVNGVAGLFEELGAVGAQAISVDWRVSLKEVRSRLSPVIAIQGNLDPYCLLRSRQEIRDSVFRMCDDYGRGPGHIVNLGHGIVPSVPEEGVEWMISAVQEWSASALS